MGGQKIKCRGIFYFFRPKKGQIGRKRPKTPQNAKNGHFFGPKNKKIEKSSTLVFLGPSKEYYAKKLAKSDQLGSRNSEKRIF